MLPTATMSVVTFSYVSYVVNHLLGEDVITFCPASIPM